MWEEVTEHLLKICTMPRDKLVEESYKSGRAARMCYLRFCFDSIHNTKSLDHFSTPNLRKKTNLSNIQSAFYSKMKSLLICCWSCCSEQNDSVYYLNIIKRESFHVIWVKITKYVGLHNDVSRIAFYVSISTLLIHKAGRCKGVLGSSYFLIHCFYSQIYFSYVTCSWSSNLVKYFLNTP